MDDIEISAPKVRLPFTEESKTFAEDNNSITPIINSDEFADKILWLFTVKISVVPNWRNPSTKILPIWAVPDKSTVAPKDKSPVTFDTISSLLDIISTTPVDKSPIIFITEFDVEIKYSFLPNNKTAGIKFE